MSPRILIPVMLGLLLLASCGKKPGSGDGSAVVALSGDVENFNPVITNSTIAAEVDKTLVGLDYQLPGEGEVQLRLLTKKDPAALSVMRHSCAHVMARAVTPDKSP